MQTPKFLRNLLQSNNYWNKNSTEFAKANEYLEKLYPVQLSADLSGRFVEPPYDMTLEQFESAQRQFDKDLEDAIHEAEDSVDDANGTAEPIDYDQYVDIEETIDVRVLMPGGNIEYMQLVVYMLNLPDDDTDVELEPDKTQRIWIWHSEEDENVCDDCVSHDDEVFEDKDDIPEIPVHPNCRCWVEEVKLDDNGKPISSKAYKGQKPEIPKNDKEPQSEKTPTFDKPVDIKEGQYATFDGKNLTIFQDGKVVASWNAVSGRPEYQSPEYQNLKSTGPIPEGAYVARQEKLQHMSPADWAIGWSRVLGNKFGGKWPGSSVSWGNSRVWLEPSKETNTFGRDKFSIHGGLFPGSAGCIDLTDQINSFTSWLESTGKDLLIYVKYK
ncbi:MAG: DUF2778 domain-containing protein [Alphaproteobacteria bacterium]|nr:DUF2778 domain-containing protein [Alphaproteobacteria bacterium]